jgi:hypothetical protein
MRNAVFCLLVACSGGSPAKTDAAKMDSMGSAGMCLGSAYDPCTSNAQCTSQMCHNYTMSAFQVCTVTCTPGDNTTCPKDSTGANGTCNNMANCKPAQPNNCHF